MTAEIESPTGLRVFSIISSSFFWPYPHPKAKRFQRTGTLDGGNAGIFSIRQVSKLTNDDNFTRLTIGSSGIDIRVFGRKGTLLQSNRIDF